MEEKRIVQNRLESLVWCLLKRKRKKKPGLQDIKSGVLRKGSVITVMLMIANIGGAFTVPSTISHVFLGLVSFHPHTTSEMDTHIVPF